MRYLLIALVLALSACSKSSRVAPSSTQTDEQYCNEHPMECVAKAQ